MGVSIDLPASTVALVTGASRGIGRATAASIAAAGAHTIVGYLHQETAAEEVADGIHAAGGSASTAQVDIADESQVRDLFRSIRDRHGRLDVVVANAGVVDDGYATVMSAAKFDRVVGVNLRGTFFVCREAMRMMCRQRSGSIITVASSSGLRGVEGQANYSASKGGILSMTRAIADEGARFGIRANVVAPGYIETDMSRSVRPDLKDFYRQRIPLDRFAEPEEVASVITFLASPLASYVTGECVRVDGGLQL
jgi:3-oxoacyl-[acyl-carrier protein] reductase